MDARSYVYMGTKTMALKTKLIIAAATLLMTTPAAAQNICAPRTDMVKRITEAYSETQVAVGLAVTGNLIETFVSDAGSFTVIITNPNGVSCVAVTGTNWATEGFPKPFKPVKSTDR